ncbi:unnamed protein product [Prunus armeniaca]
MTNYRSGFNFERKERRNLSYKHFSTSTFLQGDPFLGIFRTLDLLSPLLITLMFSCKFELEVEIGKPKQAHVSSSTFLQGDLFLGILRTLDLLSPLLITLMSARVKSLTQQVPYATTHIKVNQEMIAGGAAHSGEFGCKYLTMISTPSHLESGTICVSVFPTQQHPTQKSAGPKRHRSVECVQVFWPCDFEFTMEGNDEAILSWSFCGLANNKSIPPVADMRYESFLDKSKQDIESSGLVLGRNTWRAMRVILSYLFTLHLHSPICISLSMGFNLSSISSISIIGGADGSSPSKMRALANVDPIDVARSIASCGSFENLYNS